LPTCQFLYQSTTTLKKEIMMRMLRFSLLFSSFAMVAACDQTPPSDATAPPAVVTAPAMSAPAVVAPAVVETAVVAPMTTEPVAAAAVTGVVECDDYLAKYEACLNDKLPVASRAQFQAGLDSMRTSWAQLAANPQTAGALAQACTQAKASAVATMQAYGCTF
jgi:hypothetical protein